jgi:hydroxymethylpyrimidine/phosphomethylpyrimidine kinase
LGSPARGQKLATVSDVRHEAERWKLRTAAPAKVIPALLDWLHDHLAASQSIPAWCTLQAMKLPCALALGGLDPGGGAGILADVRAIQAAGAFGAAALTLTTVQSTNGLRSVSPLPVAHTMAMAREVLKAQDVRAVKTGALGGADMVRAIARLLTRSALPAVVDPVMGATRGAGNLLESEAVTAVRKHLLPRAMVLTPNVPEAEALTRRKIRSMQDAHDAAAQLCTWGAHSVLLKGGHMRGAFAVDLWVTAKGQSREFASKRYPLGGELHGGGCTLASLIAGRLALGEALEDAIAWSKKRLSKALRDVTTVGGALRVVVP